MSTLRNLSAALFAVAVALTTSVQAQTAPAGAMPMTGDAMSHDCAKPMRKHDHGAEKGTPTPSAASAPCTAAMAAPAPAEAASSAKKAAGHDHSKFHKTM
jgi:hypothetical protein